MHLHFCLIWQALTMCFGTNGTPIHIINGKCYKETNEMWYIIFAALFHMTVVISSLLDGHTHAHVHTHTHVHTQAYRQKKCLETRCMSG